MGTRTRTNVKPILPEDVLAELAKTHLKAPQSAPDGDEDKFVSLDPRPFSRAIEAALLERFNSTKELRTAWLASAPIALGSWSRGELCPKSDLDILFSGDEKAAGEITGWAQEAGLKIRSRIPEDPRDWTIGVEPFDVAALYKARALTAEAEQNGVDPIAKVRAGTSRFRGVFLKACRTERKLRNERYDSIANFLEPNLKYGTGALRDLAQALQLREFFSERFGQGQAHAEQVYEYYRRFFLLARMRVHMAEGGGDLLSAYEQQPLSEWFGFASPRDFMREVQKGLSRVAFYTDIDFERSSTSVAALKAIDAKTPTKFSELASWLEKDPSLLIQAKARDEGFRLYRKDPEAQVSLQRLMVKTTDPLQDEDLAIAVFRSRWIDLAVTDFKKIIGHVQHDQYHRYTVDAHLLQAVREMKRIAKRPTLVGRLAPIVKSMTKEDWKVLGWSALYHDVGKGSGGDHSDRSVEIAKIDFARYGFDSTMIDEILWLIDHHLDLSVAAFRGNPADPKVWRQLREKGIEGRRLLRLLIFTAVDIRATNHEAYTPWKERLLFELVQNLEKPEAKNLAKLERELEAHPEDLKAKKREQLRPCLDRLDPFLLAALPVKTLARDLIEVASGRSQSVKVARISKTGRVWIRFQTHQDRPGLFAAFARVLQTAGLSVRHASVLSDETLGVYDWFEVKPPRSLKGLEVRLQKALAKTATESNDQVSVEVQKGESKVEFDAIELLSASETEWVISFRGRDQKGALRAAVEALSSLGVSITWAKVHTWGRQLDDVFGVVPSRDHNVESLLSSLTKRLI